MIKLTSLLFTGLENVNKYESSDIIFKDLNLDSIISEVLRYAKLFDISKYFYMPLKNKDDVIYRHEVFKDLENASLFDALNKFSYTLSKKLKEIDVEKNLKFDVLKRVRLKQKIEEYLDILSELVEALGKEKFSSRALKAMNDYIVSYLNSENVKFVMSDMKLITEEMSKVKYRLYFDNGSIKIAKNDDVTPVEDKIGEVLDAYECDEVLQFTRDYGQIPVHFLGQIYKELSSYYPNEFKHLELFSKHFEGFIDETIKGFANDIQFYIAYIEMQKRIKSMGLEFTYPSIDSGKVYCEGGYDLALAISFYIKKKKIVTNTFEYKDGESVIVVSGPNQGGKTTYSRYVGQTFYLAALGLPITGISANLSIVDRIFTMYEVEEESSNLNGKLKSELIRIKNIMDKMQENTLLIMNEVFASTSLEDGIVLGKNVIDMINEKNSKALFVTFIEELSSYNSTTVSMGSTVDKDDPSIRTFEILRRLDNSNAYAKSIAKKNLVSYEDIIRRIG